MQFTPPPGTGSALAGPLQFGVHVKLIRRNVVSPLALAKTATAPSWWWIVGDEMVWLGAGLLIAAVIMTIWLVLHG
jgi:hypothetical protein